jgi:hypothetical protein
MGASTEEDRLNRWTVAMNRRLVASSRSPVASSRSAIASSRPLATLTRSFVSPRRWGAALALLALAACGGGDSGTSPTDGGTLVVVDLVVGTGPVAAVGDTVNVHYVGTFTNGVKFDSSYDRGQVFSFRVGAGQVIAGWDQGVPGMRVGGRRRLTVPPSLGYGSQAYGPIPANSTLVFEIELVSIVGK